MVVSVDGWMDVWVYGLHCMDCIAWFAFYGLHFMDCIVMWVVSHYISYMSCIGDEPGYLCKL